MILSYRLFLISFETCNEIFNFIISHKQSCSCLHNSIVNTNIFVMEIFSSGTLSRIHAPHRIGWPVLTYRSPIALDENIRSIYRLTLKSLSCVIQMSLVASFERLVLRYVCNIYSDMSRWSHISKTSDLMLKRDTTSSLNMCCDIIRDIVEAWSTSSLSFTPDVIQDITRALRKPCAIYAVMIAYQYRDWGSHTSAIITL